MKRFLLTVSLLLCSAVAVAQYAGPIARVSTQMPVEEPCRGHYFDPAKPGTGMNVDFGTIPNNGSPYQFVYITYYSYATDGAQKWYSITGKYVANGELQRARTGVIGSLTDITIYSTQGGEPVTGPYHASTPIIENLSVSLTWTSPRRATLTIGSNSWKMAAASFTGGDGGLLPGRWGLSAHVSYGPSDGTRSIAHYTVDVTPAPFDSGQLSLAPASAPGVTLPPATAKLYLVQCVVVQSDASRCQAFGNLLTAYTYSSTAVGLAAPTMAMWVDEATGRAGIEMLNSVTGTSARVGPENWHFDLYPDVNRMTGHGIHLWTSDDSFKNVLDSTFLFEKVPDFMIDFSRY